MQCGAAVAKAAAAQALQRKQKVAAREKAVAQARRQLDVDPSRRNIVICGPSGVGKSSLINAITGKRAGDDGWAPVGERECTTDIARYDVPGTNVTLWDLPGGNTETHPSDTYYSDKNICAFNEVLLLFTSRFYSTCKRVMEGCRDLGQRISFVRNFADADIRGVQRRNGLDLAGAVEHIRAAMRLQIGDIRSADRLFLISSQDMQAALPLADGQKDIQAPFDGPRLRAYLTT